MNYTTYANKIKQISYDIAALIDTKKNADFKVIGNDIDKERPEKWPYRTGYIHAGGWLKNINKEVKVGDIIYQNNLSEIPPKDETEAIEYWKNFLLFTKTSNLVFIPFYNKVIGQKGIATSVEMEYFTLKDFFPQHNDKLNYSILYSTAQPNIYDLNFEVTSGEANLDIPINFNYAPMLPFITDAVVKQSGYFRFNNILSIDSTNIFSTENFTEDSKLFTIKINENIYYFNQVYIDSSNSSMSFRYHYVEEDEDKYSPNITVYSNGKWISELYKEIRDPAFWKLVENNTNLAKHGKLYNEYYETLIIDNNFSFDKNKKPLLKLKSNSSCNYLWLWR